MKEFDTTRNISPYGSWTHPTEKQRFYSDKGEFYSNTDEIKQLQERLGRQNRNI